MRALTLELPESLYQQLEAQARSEGLSLTQFALSRLTGQESVHYRMEPIPPEVREQQREAYENFAASLGTASEEEIDQILAEREPGGPESELSPEVLARFQQLLQSKRALSSAARQGD